MCPLTLSSITNLLPTAKLTKVREGRELLVKYLREMNFTDDVIHAQGLRMKALLDDWPPMATAAAPDVQSVTRGKPASLCARPP